MKLKIMMPIDKDGDYLKPEYKEKQGYNIGKSKAHVEKLRLDPRLTCRIFANYFEAIIHLYNLPKPYWRRPNKTSGKFGVMTNINGWNEVEIEYNKEITDLDREYIEKIKQLSDEIKKN